ncbi:MAG: aminoacyl--tRNA ligase-related protein [Nitratireductor sp.]
MLRQHQFWKVELVSVTDREIRWPNWSACCLAPKRSCSFLACMSQVMTPCSGDMGFGARKHLTDIEVWLPGQNAYREISSCFGLRYFRARRMNARYRLEDGKSPAHCHTLNGSGVAVGRALIAVLENGQNEDGSVTVPRVLRPYMGGQETIGGKA